MDLRLLVYIFLASTIAGCATPATSFLQLDYKKPAIPLTDAAVTGKEQKKLKSLTVSNKIFTLPDESPAVKISEVAVKATLGTGISRPDVKKKDPWSIVLSKVHLGNVKKGLLDGAPNVAVLLRVNSGDGSDIDGKWVLAAIGESVPVPSDLNFDNLLVWSGITDKTIVIDIQFVKLNKADKERMQGYLSVVSLVSTAIPQYGPIAASIVKAGEAINEGRSDYTVLLTYRAGFHPEHSLKYAAYALVPQEVAMKYGNGMWYDINSIPADQIKVGDDTLASNWCAFRIIKGSSRTFEYARTSSLDSARKIADDWVSTNNPIASISSLKMAVGGLISSAEAARITNNIDFKNSKSIYNALKDLKKRQSDPDPATHIKDSDYIRLLQIVESYLPAELIPSPSASLDDWLKNIEKLSTYHYDSEKEAWVKNT